MAGAQWQVEAKASEPSQEKAFRHPDDEEALLKQALEEGDEPLPSLYGGRNSQKSASYQSHHTNC